MKPITRINSRVYRWSPVFIVSVAFVAGIIFWGGFNWSMELTNTESFCISCHEMEQNVYQEYQHTMHYTNRTGVRATCPDCHVPKEWGYKVVRKVRATNELFHWIAGSIDTREKFLAKRLELASHVWKSMRETDSRECRNCHGNDFMALEKQSPMAKKMHELGIKWNETCINCHQGIAHELPTEFDKEIHSDEMHRRIEKEGLPCHECHEDVYKAPVNDIW